jgi:sugar O-acyltransferase (sialic acid O-acetyltransferase NeuD family)
MLAPLIPTGFYASSGEATGRSGGMMLKRIFDFSLALITAIVLSPFLLLLSSVILIFQGRPVLFTQPRVGYKGKVFNLYKFRTMKPFKDGENPHSMDRLTRVGKIIRSLSLDELPSLYNVIKGDMSLVGPRPLLVEYLERYSEREMKRHDALPGLTGWAQVNGRNTLSWSEKFRYDVTYVENQSFWLDLKIIFLTVKILFWRQGINASGSEVMEEFDPGLYVIGAGGHAKVIISTLKACDLKISGIFDDNVNLKGHNILGIPVLGPVAESRNYKVKKAIIGIGSNSIREAIAKEYGYNWVSVIHPQAVVDPSVKIGKGSVVFAGAVINADTVLQDHAIINTGALIDHDCIIESFVHICPGTVLTGGVHVAEGSFLGAGTKVIPGKKIGQKSIVGAGSVVIKDLPGFCTAVGNPAVIIKEKVAQIQRKKA